ncbi:MAG: FAD:protein FMN transferase [Flavobacteriaceae bacterium]
MDKRFLIAFLFVCFSCSQEPQINKHQGFALGTTYSIQYAPISADYDQVQNGIDSLFYVINKSLSTYLPESDITKINQGDSTLIVDQHFKNVFRKANTIWYKTQGYFDPTVGAWVNAYGFGPDKTLNSISYKQNDSLMDITGWARIQMRRDGRVVKDNPKIYIDFNAIAKGYTVDIIANYLTKKGSENHLIEIGGELVAKGTSPKSGEAWKIGIDNPNQTTERSLQTIVSLTDQALATSGNYRKFRIDSISKEKFVHSINPLTGRPARSRVLSASVKAPDCMTADALATALMVMPFSSGKALIEADPKLAAYWIISSGQGVDEVFSSRWKVID